MSRRYRRYSVMYEKIIQKCMKYVTDNNGNISMEKLSTNGRKIMGISWVCFIGSIILLVLGTLSLAGFLILGKAVTLGIILFFVLYLIGILMMSIGPALLQTGYTFKIASQCLKDDIKVEKCPFCGNILEDDHTFCGKCGARFKMQTTCEHCATVNNYGAKFCKKCGSSLVSKIGNKKTDSKNFDDHVAVKSKEVE